MKPSKISLSSSQQLSLGMQALTVGPLATNCYLLWAPETREALVVDPGAEPENILMVVEHLGLRVTRIVNTHGHADHIGANAALKRRTQARLLIHAADAPLLLDPEANLSLNAGWPIVSPGADETLHAGQTLLLGKTPLAVLGTPGHSPGSICLWGNGCLFSGDTLFAGSVGRTDLRGGDTRALFESLRTRILPLPPETRVYPGHGPVSDLATELRDNPFLAEGGPYGGA